MFSYFKQHYASNKAKSPNINLDQDQSAQFIFCKMSKWNIVLWTTCSGSQLGAKIESSTPNPLIRQREIFIVLFSNKKKMSRTIQEKKTTGGCFGATPIEQRACSLRWKPLSSHMAAVVHCFQILQTETYFNI